MYGTNPHCLAARDDVLHVHVRQRVYEVHSASDAVANRRMLTK